MNFDYEARRALLLDARGLKCPLPVLKLEKALANAPAGAQVTVLATDPVAKIDIPLFCRQQGHAVAVESEPDGATRFLITKSLGDRD
ncbi:sulfurtransferase TusA family protein [Pelagibacterium sp. H642]|uniref:sulfurtransferase TusA family protein n=1 Tax=Pelagibacterium sp. H642 TaxID=1881069 RepID=UPI0028158788|nr:sulfurtransferase TusA family protein [Pelagibacterium sp. H642]WMT89147.1 sulfurtransferase TusA family protein [Pelagibacterium sp. H642]